MTPTRTIHVLAPFHTVPRADFSHCAFTGKAERFSAMMVARGWRCIEYANEGSTSAASEHVPLLTTQEREAFFPPLKPGESHGDRAWINTPGFAEFDRRLRSEMGRRIRHGDIVAHVFGRPHAGLLSQFPDALHVETGVGYPDAPFGAWRVFESEAWRHWHWGHWDARRGELPDCEREGGFGSSRVYSFVIPNYYETRDWPLGVPRRDRPYVAYMARLAPPKGSMALAEMIRRFDLAYPDSPLAFHVAGQGDEPGFLAACGSAVHRVVTRGSLTGPERAEFLGGALALLAPTQFVEPFGGAAVEAQLCGVPTIAVDWGAYTETVNVANGYRCKTLRDWITALRRVELGAFRGRQRATIQARARGRYSLAACGALYETAFASLAEVKWAAGYAA